LSFFTIWVKDNLAQSVDSVQQLDTVNITGQPVKRKESPSIFYVDILQKKFSAQNNIGELLQVASPVQINSYGLGNTASISIRGGNDDHTNVYWNGLKINSLTLGGTDVSLIPVESGEDIMIQTNSASIGGDINIYSKPDWRNVFAVRARSDFGSFQHIRNSLGIKAGNRRVQFQSNTFYLNAKNNFSYTDLYKFDHPTDTANHNSIKSVGTVNALFIQLKKMNFISIGSWFALKNKNVPSIMGSYEESNKFQKDMAVRHFINWDKYNDNASYHVSFSHSYDELKYTDKKLPTDTILLINSSYNTHRITNTFSTEHSFMHNIKLTSGYVYNLLIADVKEYAKKVIDHVGDVYSQINISSGNIQSQIKMTQPFSSFKYIRPQFYIDAGYTLTNRKYGVQFSYSDKYRFPDLNDRYWNPGGNPKLRPETGWTVNLGNTLKIFPDSESKEQLNAQVSFYYSKIKNNIVWTPITNIIWSPKNLKSTRLYGVEAQLTYGYRTNNGWLFSVNEIYNFNRAQILKDENNSDLEGNFLRYKPQHIFKANWYTQYRSLGIGFNYQYVSARFTDEENFDFFELKPYHLMDMYITFQSAFKEHDVQFIFKVNNITNTSYESIRSYAQPLRYYTFSFIYNFNHQK
jgi:iron complex outermembrane receptor protein